MSRDKQLFSKGDKVKAPGDKTGTVKWVGKIDNKSGVFVGVEYDEPVGKHDGKFKGKTYWKGKKNHCVIEKQAIFTKDSKSSSKPKKSKKKGENKNAPEKIVQKPLVARAAAFVQTDPRITMEENFSNKDLCEVVTQILINDKELAEQQVAEYRNKLNEIHKQQGSDSSKIADLEHQLKTALQDRIKHEEDLELKDIEIEELQIRLQLAEIEIEEYKERLSDGITNVVEKVSADDKEKAELVRMNQELQTALKTLLDEGQKAVEEKDKKIESLHHDSSTYVPTLNLRIKQLTAVEKNVIQLKAKVEDYEEQLKELNRYKHQAKILAEHNSKYEGELQDWREYVLDVEAERKILEELHENDEEYIGELYERNKQLKSQLDNLTKEKKQLDIQNKDLMKQLFELRNKLDQVNDSNFGPELHELSENKVDSIPSEVSMKENVKLKSQLKQVKKLVLNRINDFVNGQENYVLYTLMNQYIPKHSPDIDVRGLNILKNLQRILYKAKESRNILELLYGNKSSSFSANYKLAIDSYTLCPLIIQQENYIRAIQRGFVTISDIEDWKQKISKLEAKNLEKIENFYDNLIGVIEKSEETNNLAISLEELSENEKKLQSYIELNFGEFNPDKKRRDEERIDKLVVLQKIGETRYRFLEMSIRLNQFNSKVYNMLNQARPTVVSNTEVDEKYEKDDEIKESNSKKLQNNIYMESLKIGALEKIFRLNNDLLEQTEEILKHSQPIELGYTKTTYSSKLLDEANKTSVKFGSVKLSKSLSLNAVERIEVMVKKLNDISVNMSNPKETVDKINEIIGNEEESNQNGLISILENAHDTISEVLKVIGSALYSTVKTTDDMPLMKFENCIPPIWEVIASKFKQVFENSKERENVLHQTQQTVKKIQSQKSEVDSDLKAKLQIISILQDQIEKEKQKSTALKDIQLENKKLSDTFEENENRIKSLMLEDQTKSDLIVQLKDQLERYKKSAARSNHSRLQSSQDLSFIQLTSEEKAKDRRDSIFKSNPIRSESPDGRGKKMNSHKSANLTNNGINIFALNHLGTKQVKGIVSSQTQYQESSLEYASMLQDTIQTLRKKLTQLSLKKKIMQSSDLIDFPHLFNQVNEKKTEKKEQDQQESDQKLIAVIDKMDYFRSRPTIIDLCTQEQKGQNAIGRQIELKRLYYKLYPLKNSIQSLKTPTPGNQLIGEVVVPSDGQALIKQNVFLSPSSIDEIQRRFMC